MTFDENTATSLKKRHLSFLKAESMELNLSNKMLKFGIEGFYEAVCWRKVGSNLRFSADPRAP